MVVFGAFVEGEGKFIFTFPLFWQSYLDLPVDMLLGVNARGFQESLLGFSAS
jgi:hypothetical protein